MITKEKIIEDLEKIRNNNNELLAIYNSLKSEDQLYFWERLEENFEHTQQILNDEL